MIDYSDWDIPGAMTFATDGRQLHRDGNHTLRGTGSFDQTHVLPGYAGARLAGWDMSMVMSYTIGAMNKDGKNKQSTDTSCQYATSGGHSTHYHSSGNASENDIARNKNQEPQPYAEVDPDDRRSQVTIPTREETTTTNLVRCWLHNCNGRSFTHLSNYRRHYREKSRLQVGFSYSLWKAFHTQVSVENPH
jgi:hypothetical protein